MSFQDDVAPIAAEHGPDVAIEYAAQTIDAVWPGTAEPIRAIWAGFFKDLLPLYVAASSGAVHELDYYTTEVTRVL